MVVDEWGWLSDVLQSMANTHCVLLHTLKCDGLRERVRLKREQEIPMAMDLRLLGPKRTLAETDRIRVGPGHMEAYTGEQVFRIVGQRMLSMVCTEESCASQKSFSSLPWP